MTVKSGFRRTLQPTRSRVHQWLRGTHPTTTTRFPKTVVGTKLYDQFGNVYVMRSLSSWAMAQNLTTAQITTALNGVQANGWNAIHTVMGGGQSEGGDWDRYHDIDGNPFWTGTPWASSLGSAWGKIDWIISEANRLGIVVGLSLFGGFGGDAGTEGAGQDWNAVTNTNMNTAGQAIANRYLANDNIYWHLEFDGADTPSSTTTRAVRAENFFAGVNTVEGKTRRIRWMESNQDNGTSADRGWDASTNFAPTINTGYVYNANSTEDAEGWRANVAGVPFGDSEPPYDGAGHYGTPGGSVEAQNLRERSYALALEGAALITYGHEQWWNFGKTGLFGGDISGDWTNVMSHSHVVQQSYFHSLVDAYIANPLWGPTSSFLTTGEGSGDTKAAVGMSNVAAIVYFPDSRTIAVDTTVLGGNGPVRLRWYDPTNGAYSTIAASEAQQTGRSITYAGNNAAGESDQVLVVDLVTQPIPPVPAPLRILTTVPHRARRGVA